MTKLPTTEQPLQFAIEMGNDQGKQELPGEIYAISIDVVVTPSIDFFHPTSNDACVCILRLSFKECWK
jgi:hypothetical protein